MRRAKVLLNTLVEIDCSDSNFWSEQAIQAGFNAIEQVQNRMNFYDPTSELSVVNRNAQFEPQAVSPELYSLLELAKELYKLSDGAFDIVVPNEDGPIVNSTMIELTEANQVYFTEELQVNLSGIAKGFAVDQAVKSIADFGVESVLVNAGGDLRTFGEPRTVLVRDPENPYGQFCQVILGDGALATSGQYFNHAHLFDRSTNQAWAEARSVTVVSPNSTIADALTKCSSAAPAIFLTMLDQFESKAYTFNQGSLVNFRP